MTLKPLDIQKMLDEITAMLETEKNLSPALVAAIKMLMLVMQAMMGRLGLNSTNSSQPPSQDPHRRKKPATPAGRKPGGQPGHPGTTLRPIDNPDATETILIDKRTLPRGTYRPVGFERRQVFNIRTERHVTEFRAEILEDESGRRYTAPFPEGVTRPVQYGRSVRAHAVYLSQFQLIPYDRVVQQFADTYALPLGAGTVANFNQEAYERLEVFEGLARQQLIASPVLHADETGINIGGKKIWLHNASSDHWTLYIPHERRGTEAMDAMGILPDFAGTLVHDHWKPYFTFHCAHALCNAHHLRELAYAHEMEGQGWAKKMHDLLLALNEAVTGAGGQLDPVQQALWRRRHRKILGDGDLECPPPVEESGKRGRMKRGKSRNLLERLRAYEQETLRFMVDGAVPFTNNQGERDIRMTKVQQKVSGCFRSVEGARYFCRIRSYLSTCRKQGVSPSDALDSLFNGKWPQFVQDLING